ncbi:MAG: cupin [Acidimicrobiales bacterium]|nr:cupin [Acidimicrobiales bacterium]MYD32609.1 cupin [Acidimicrobiales bacterium]MYI09415.1 cupin [Acidimicrobiales bacterium]
MGKQEFEFFDPELLAWEPEAGINGLYSKTLSEDPDSGSYTRLLKFLPGTDTSAAGVQLHDFWEEIWLVEGAIHDLTLDQTFTKGMYACRPPGMAHGPWVSPNGAITFEVRNFD